MTDIARVTVLGTGVLGSQIIMQNAYHGKNVVAYDISDEVLAKLPSHWDWMRGHYKKDLPDFTDARFDEALGRITTTTNLAEAVAEADLVIEAVPENLELKREVWADVGAAAPDRTIFATNSSSLLPSDMAESTGRPARFGTLHFANMIWRQNMGEVMGHPGTDPEVLDTIAEYATEIDIVPFRVRKETPGYLLNSVLIPWLDAGAKLYVDGVGTVEDIDGAWRMGTGAPLGPFQIYDIVGFNVAYNIGKNRAEAGDEDSAKFNEVLKVGLDSGKNGLGAGEGFYVYDQDGAITGRSSQYPEVWDK